MNFDHEDQVKFSELALPEPLIQATKAADFEYCTPVQGLTLPHIIDGKDVAAQAQTGTGKTAAFLLGAMTVLLNREDKDNRRQNQPRMVVIAPTRELAIQIGRDAETLGQFAGFSIRVVYGGADYEKQRRALTDGVDILIGTPGRLIDYYKKKVFDLKALEIVVLDEADRMFDLGFIADIRFMLRRMPSPADRISMLFSATLSNRVMELAYEHMNNPVTIKTESDSVTAAGVRQQLFHPATDEKISLLIGLLQHLNPPRTIVFVNTRRASETVEGYLLGNGISCGTLSGDVRQKKRQRILAEFTEGKIPVLIATDVAARGLHIDDVTHVFNFDLPQQAEDYVHRIGRTARAGSEGEALSFACEKYSFSLPDIIEYIGEEIQTTPITNDLLPELAPPKAVERDRVQKHNSSSRPNRNRKPHTNRPSKSRSDQGESSQRRPQTSGTNPDATNGKHSSGEAQPGETGSANPSAAKKKRRRRRRRKPGVTGEQSGE